MNMHAYYSNIQISVGKPEAKFSGDIMPVAVGSTGLPENPWSQSIGGRKDASGARWNTSWGVLSK